MSIHCYNHSTINPLEYEAKYILKTLAVKKSNLRADSSTESIKIGLENGKMLAKTVYYQEFVDNDFIVYKSANLIRNKTHVSGTL